MSILPVGTTNRSLWS